METTTKQQQWWKNYDSIYVEFNDNDDHDDNDNKDSDDEDNVDSGCDGLLRQIAREQSKNSIGTICVFYVVTEIVPIRIWREAPGCFGATRFLKWQLCG